jgi:hypothetical protein
MYDKPMATDPAITVAAGDGAAFYPAAVLIQDRDEPGLRFSLTAGGPWQWTGPGGPAEATLTDVLAAVNNARLARLPGYEAIDLAAVHAAHQAAARAALAGGDAALADRLMTEQSEVAVIALVSEEVAAGRLGIGGRSMDNMRLEGRICPPVFIAGDRRTKWFWAPAQFDAWLQARPGKGWRLGAPLPGSPAAAARSG